MEPALSAIKAIVGGEVVDSEVGHGSFIDLVVETPGPVRRTIRLWVYLADWALLEGDEEIVSSDMGSALFARTRDRLGELVGAMVKSVDFLNEDEVHIAFTGHRRLEIWRPEQGGEPGDALIKVSVDGRYLDDVERFDVARPKP